MCISILKSEKSEKSDKSVVIIYVGVLQHPHFVRRPCNREVLEESSKQLSCGARFAVTARASSLYPTLRNFTTHPHLPCTPQTNFAFLRIPSRLNPSLILGYTLERFSPILGYVLERFSPILGYVLERFPPILGYVLERLR